MKAKFGEGITPCPYCNASAQLVKNANVHIAELKKRIARLEDSHAFYKKNYHQYRRAFTKEVEISNAARDQAKYLSKLMKRKIENYRTNFDIKSMQSQIRDLELALAARRNSSYRDEILSLGVALDIAEFRLEGAAMEIAELSSNGEQE